jgi:competence protein ComEC
MDDFLRIKNPMVYITLTFSLGIIIGNFTELKTTSLLLILALGSLLTGVLYLKRINFFSVVFLFFILLWGIFWVIVNSPTEGIFDHWEGKNVELTGQVHSITSKNNQFLLEVSSLNNQSLRINPTLLVAIPSYVNQETLQWGDMVKVKGRLLATSPGTNPGEFSEKSYWKNYGVAYKLIVNREINVVEKSQGFKRFINSLREKIYTYIGKGIPEEESALALGLILGEKSQMDPDLYGMFQKLGVVHIFAVSGLHVGVLVGLYLWITTLLKIPKKYSIFGALLIFGGYAILIGLTPSVLRASIMALLTMALMLGLKHKDYYSILATSGLIILIINPYNLFTVGFQLSFVTTWGLIYLFPLAQRALFFLPLKIQKILAVPVAAQLAALPITIYYFNTLSFWAPLVNVIYVAMVGILVPLLFISLLISFVFFFLAQPFLYLAGGILFLLSAIARILTKILPYASFYMGTPTITSILLYYLLLIALVEIGGIKKILTFRQQIILSLIVILLVFIPAIPTTQLLQYTFLDVGQGDSAVIQTPYQHFIVIDGGPSANRVNRYLQYLGANRVELMVLSHSHSDHINGLFNIIKNIPTRILLIPHNGEETKELEELKRLALSKNTQVIEGKRGMRIRFPGGLNLKVISPGLDVENWDANNGSLILQASYGTTKVLFTGDVEREMIQRIIPFLSPSDILKIPHHGSRSSYSPSFYNILNPRIAIIQSGQGNKFDHPHPEVIEALQEKEITIYRNDQQGAIFVKSDGNIIQVKTFLNVLTATK